MDEQGQPVTDPLWAVGTLVRQDLEARARRRQGRAQAARPAAWFDHGGIIGQRTVTPALGDAAEQPEVQERRSGCHAANLVGGV